MCGRCKEEKLRSEFNRRKKGLQPWCRHCQKSTLHNWKGQTGYDKRLREERRRNGYHKRYAASRGGIIRSLISQRGYGKREAEVLADILLDPEARCAICGVPNKVLRALYRAGYTFPWGRPEQNRRLTPDNLQPGKRHVLANTRILCLACNARRGPNLRSDESVLAWVREQWRLRLSDKYLWWMK